MGNKFTTAVVQSDLQTKTVKIDKGLCVWLILYRKDVLQKSY